MKNGGDEKCSVENPNNLPFTNNLAKIFYTQLLLIFLVLLANFRFHSNVFSFLFAPHSRFLRFSVLGASIKLDFLIF